MATPTIKEIQAKADELQEKLDVEQQQVADLLAAKEADIVAKQAVIDQLNVTVTDLTAQLADGGTQEERQAVIDKLTSAIADLEATVTPAE